MFLPHPPSQGKWPILESDLLVLIAFGRSKVEAKSGIVDQRLIHLLTCIFSLSLSLSLHLQKKLKSQFLLADTSLAAFRGIIYLPKQIIRGQKQPALLGSWRRVCLVNQDQHRVGAKAFGRLQDHAEGEPSLTAKKKDYEGLFLIFSIRSPCKVANTFFKIIIIIIRVS